MRASLCLFLILAAATRVEAQAERPRSARDRSASEQSPRNEGSVPASPSATAQKKLESSDPALVAEGLTELAAIGGDAAALAVSNRLMRGLPPQLTEAAIDALRGLARPNAAPVLL